MIYPMIIHYCPQICNGCSEKLTIKIWGLGPKNHVIGSRDEKTDATTELLGYEIPHKKVQTDNLTDPVFEEKSKI